MRTTMRTPLSRTAAALADSATLAAAAAQPAGAPPSVSEQECREGGGTPLSSVLTSSGQYVTMRLGGTHGGKVVED
ncbi:hypothetical protein ACSNOI_44105 [Actinomadura kijaniata]|uniref:hypothetical protein n=1 Tax=Actinomadura kijaniata TaxID=46161 RepID=UPI003F1DD65D